MASLGTLCKFLAFCTLISLLTHIRALAAGPERERFLGIATPKNVARMKASDATGTIFQRSDNNRSYSTFCSYTPSAVWTWMLCREEEPRMLLFSDV